MSILHMARATVVGSSGLVDKLHNTILIYEVRQKVPSLDFTLLATPAGLMAIRYEAKLPEAYPIVCSILNGTAKQAPGMEYSLKDLLILVEYGQEQLHSAMFKSLTLAAHGRDKESVIGLFQLHCRTCFAAQPPDWLGALGSDPGASISNSIVGTSLDLQKLQIATKALEDILELPSSLEDPQWLDNSVRQIAGNAMRKIAQGPSGPAATNPSELLQLRTAS